MHVADLLPNRVRKLSAFHWWATLLALLAFLLSGALALAEVTSGNRDMSVFPPAPHSAVLRPGI